MTRNPEAPTQPPPVPTFFTILAFPVWKDREKELDVPRNGQAGERDEATSLLLAHLVRSQYVLFRFSGFTVGSKIVSFD